MQGRSVHELVELAVETYDETWEQEQAYISALRWRGTRDVLESMRLLSASDDSRTRVTLDLEPCCELRKGLDRSRRLVDRLFPL